ncbi:hypothetical protein [uncultured Flavobacterium sp.]|uniref:hypothetical protein n=1 Tax=uncultured Flavobacterium sp. TaxID=165435 RepID=UPI0025D02356|nr:hypothetical protein [uncultured Flavobacterium sp.]
MKNAIGEQKTEMTCPEKGDCTIQILENKSLDIKSDGAGKVYYSPKDNPNKNIIIYRYTQHKHPNSKLRDAGYIEEVVFETDKNITSLDYKDADLQKTRMLFGVLCYCKGKAGYYVVEEGSLLYKDNKLNISLTDIVELQRIKDISITF